MDILKKEYTPKYILYAHRIEGTDKAIYVLRGIAMVTSLTIALLMISPYFDHEIIVSISYGLLIDKKANTSVYASSDKIAMIGDFSCGLIFQLEDELNGH